MVKLAFFKKPIVVWIGVLLICLTWNYGNFMRSSKKRDQPYLFGWDNNLYFAWARSLVLDGDVDFSNDFEFIANWKGGAATQRDFAALVSHGARTPKGRMPNTTGIGLGLASVPLVLAARGMAGIHSALTGVQVSPFAAIYCIAFIFTSILISFAGLAVTFLILRERFGERPAFRAIIVGTLAMSTIYYIWFEPTMSQGAEFGFSAFFVWMLLRWQAALEAPEINLRTVYLRAFAMGILFGVLCMTHNPSLAWGVAPIVLGVYYLYDRFKQHDSKFSDHQGWIGLLGGSAGLMVLGALIGFFPQMLAWKALYGTWFKNTYEVHVYFRLIDVWNVFFDTRIGLFLWTPLAVVAVGGLAWGARRGDRLCVAGCGVFLFFMWEFTSCGLFIDGNQGHAYGMRYFVDGAFLFFLGYAVFFRWLGSLESQKYVRRLVMALVVMLVLWNLVFVIAYRADIQPHGEPIAPHLVFTNSRAWIRQAKHDINIPKMLRKVEYPLFTPLNTDANPQPVTAN